MVDLAGLLGGEAVEVECLGSAAAAERLWLIEVVVGDDTVELEAKAAGTAAGTVDRDPVGGVGRRGEAGFAAIAVADVTGSRPTSGNRGQDPERGAGVDGE